MAKEIKRASLLSEADKQKLLKKAGSKKLLAQEPTNTAPAAAVRSVSRVAARPAVDNTKNSSGQKAKVWLSLLTLLLIVFVITPKPALLQYQSAGLVTQSIYIPGWFGKSGTILDTNQRAVLVEEEQSLYLCFEGQTREQCSKYQLRQQQGLFAAALFWYSSQP